MLCLWVIIVYACFSKFNYHSIFSLTIFKTTGTVPAVLWSRSILTQLRLQLVKIAAPAPAPAPALTLCLKKKINKIVNYNVKLN